MYEERYVGAITEDGQKHCLFCINPVVNYVDDIVETDGIDTDCDNCNKELIDRAEEFNDPRREMNYIERAEDEFAEMYT